MKAELYKEIKINISFTNREVKLITKTMLLSEYKWEATAFEGFWATYVRVRKIFRDGKKDHYRDLTFREIDKIIKAFEIYTMWGIKKEQEGFELSRRLRLVLTQTNAETRLNKATTKLNLK